MKKEINSKSRRKWIMGGLAAFASVALLTTGFAVWFVGTSKTDDSNDVDVTVDTAANQSISFNIDIANEANKLKLEESKATAEANQSGKSIVNMGTDISKFVENPMKISATYTIKYGKDYAFDFNKIHFEIAIPEDNTAGTYVDNSVPTSNVLMGGTEETKGYKRAGESFTYFEVPADKVIGAPVKDDTNNWKITGDIVLDFSWGTFFDKADSPATYYNEWADEKGIESESDSNVTDALADQITKEMNAMHEKLDGHKIQLKASLIKA